MLGPYPAAWKQCFRKIVKQFCVRYVPAFRAGDISLFSSPDISFPNTTDNQENQTNYGRNSTGQGHRGARQSDTLPVNRQSLCASLRAKNPSMNIFHDSAARHSPSCIFGFPCSGTTLLQRFLNSYEDVLIWGELASLFQVEVQRRFRGLRKPES